MVCFIVLRLSSTKKRQTPWFRDGVRMAMQRVISHVHIDTDAQQVVKLWKGDCYERSEIGDILHDIKELSGDFSSFILSFVGREATHLCAKQANESRC